MKGLDLIISAFRNSHEDDYISVIVCYSDRTDRDYSAVN